MVATCLRSRNCISESCRGQRTGRERGRVARMKSERLVINLCARATFSVRQQSRFKPFPSFPASKSSAAGWNRESFLAPPRFPPHELVSLPAASRCFCAWSVRSCSLARCGCLLARAMRQGYEGRILTCPLSLLSPAAHVLHYGLGVLTSDGSNTEWSLDSCWLSDNPLVKRPRHKRRESRLVCKVTF
jgi:hypothetical protein